ncbi:MAG: N-acetyltransferase family protein [Armatimonadota bacterium]
MSEAVFRAAREEDMPEIRRIAKAAWTPIYAHFRERMGEDLWSREHPGDPLERKADSVESYVRERPEEAFVVELEGRVVGFCTFALRDNGVGVINNNAIDPALQGRGLGSAMYRECLRRMKEAGMVYATVHTGLDPSHAAARRAYEKVGFEQVRPHVEYYLKL